LFENVIAVKCSDREITMNYKYMRIQGREDSYITKYPKGVFSLCWNLIRDEQLNDEEKELFQSKTET